MGNYEVIERYCLKCETEFKVSISINSLGSPEEYVPKRCPNCYIAEPATKELETDTMTNTDARTDLVSFTCKDCFCMWKTNGYRVACPECKSNNLVLNTPLKEVLHKETPFAEEVLAFVESIEGFHERFEVETGIGVAIRGKVHSIERFRLLNERILR